MGCKRFVVLVTLLTLLVPIVRPSGGAMAAEAPDRAAEIQARESFAAGRYEDALNRFAKLYAQTLHPVYLRNIGRCHQKMREPQKAIDAFRDYLAKGKAIPTEERAEIEGYIKEMQALAEQQRLEQHQEREQERKDERERTRRTATTSDTAASGTNGTNGTATAAAPTGVPRLVQPPSGGPDLTLASASGAEDPGSSGAAMGEAPIYKKWWFWAAVGAVAVGTGVTVFLISRGGGNNDCIEQGIPCQ